MSYELKIKPAKWGKENYKPFAYDRWIWSCFGLPKTCPFCESALHVIKPGSWINNLSDPGPNGTICCYSEIECQQCNLFGVIHKYERLSDYKLLYTSAEFDLELSRTRHL